MAQQPRGHEENFSENEQMTLRQRLHYVLEQLTERRAELEPVLPVDISWSTFHSTINLALRNNPKILRCQPNSIVTACLKSAYDGLRLDGKEAALVDHRVNVGTKNQPVWEDHAEYFPMVLGLIKKILRSGKVVAMEPEVIYANDKYRLTRGTSGEIFHEPKLIGERGDAIAVYSVAILAGGERTAIFMTKADVEEVKKEAKTDFVWKRWPMEMWKKSVIRRHHKLMPHTREEKYLDMEAQAMFPQFDTETPHPQFGIGHNSRPARPTRQAAIGQSTGGSGVPLDMGAERDRETIGREMRGLAPEELARRQGFPDERDNFRRGRDDDRGDDLSLSRSKPAEDDRGPDQQQDREPAGDIDRSTPANDGEWIIWGADLEKEIGEASMDQCDDIWTEERHRLDAAPRAIADRLKKVMTDRLATLASEPPAEQGSGDGDDDTSHGAD